MVLPCPSMENPINSMKSSDFCPSCGVRVVVVFRDSSGNEKYGCPVAPDCKGKVLNESPICPQCRSPMALREGPFSKFFGCKRYPACKGTRKVKTPNNTSMVAKNDPGDGDRRPGRRGPKSRLTLEARRKRRKERGENYPVV